MKKNIMIYLLMALRSIGNAFHSPAMQAAIPMRQQKETMYALVCNPVFSRKRIILMILQRTVQQRK